MKGLILTASLLLSVASFAQISCSDLYSRSKNEAKLFSGYWMSSKAKTTMQFLADVGSNQAKLIMNQAEMGGNIEDVTFCTDGKRTLLRIGTESDTKYVEYVLVDKNTLKLSDESDYDSEEQFSSTAIVFQRAKLSAVK